MTKFLFWTSLLFTTLVGVFAWTKVSLNGYKTDFYFFIATLVINVVSFLILRKAKETKSKSYFSLFFATLQLIGLCIFLWSNTLQVDKVYEPRNNKYNLYSSLSGWYKRAYFKRHALNRCNDGELWETKVPFHFPIIEIETTRDKCHRVGNDSTYAWLYKHVPEWEEPLQPTVSLPQACIVLASPLNKNIFVVRLGRKCRSIRRPAASPERWPQFFSSLEDERITKRLF